MPNINLSLAESLSWLHGRKKRDVFVLISDDGSTLVQDPGLSRPYASPNKQFAEAQAALLRKQGVFCRAVTLEVALASVIKHPKNQPDGRS